MDFGLRGPDRGVSVSVIRHQTKTSGYLKEKTTTSSLKLKIKSTDI